MKDLKKLIELCKYKVLHGGKCPILTDIKDRYMMYFGIAKRSISYKESMNDKTGIKIADAYSDLQHSPNDFLVKKCYEQLGKEIVNQFIFLNKKEEIVFEPFDFDGEPYENSYEMLKDIHNNHLFFFKTQSGFGENNSSLQNKMLEKTEIVTNGYQLVLNDIFRIVHDVFGHAMNGYSFGPKGEDLAWYTHLQMFTPLAAVAITTETRGQNCWVNFGPHMRNKKGKIFKKNDPGFIPPQKRPFAEQKMNLLPSEISGIEVYEENGIAIAKPVENWNPFLISHQEENKNFSKTEKARI